MDYDVRIDLDEFERKLSALMLDHNIIGCVCTTIFYRDGSIQASVVAPLFTKAPFLVATKHTYLQTAAVRSVLELPGAFIKSEYRDTISVVGKKPKP